MECLQPPLLPRVGNAFSKFANRFLLEPFLTSICRGRWADTLSCRIYRGTIDGNLVATGWLGWSKQRPGIGVMAGVATDPMYRGQGIATNLCGMVCEDFDSDGGQYLYLAAATVVARRVYERLGFRTIAGQFLCRGEGELPPQQAFAPGSAVQPRHANWGDAGNVMPLYSMPHPCILVDTITKFVSMRLQDSNRCVGLFWRMWHAYLEHGGHWDVLENEHGWIVASAVAQPHDHECRVDFLWHPNYESEGKAFVRQFIQQRAAESPCRMTVCAEDTWKLARAEAIGFVRTDGSAGSIELDTGQLELINLCWQS